MTLESFEGRKVLASGVEMPGASGGLNKALVVNDLELHHGDEGALIVWFKVAKVRFDPVNDSEALERVHVLKVTNAAPAGLDEVDATLDRQRIAQEEREGVRRLGFGADDEDPPDEDQPAIEAPEA